MFCVSDRDLKNSESVPSNAFEYKRTCVFSS